MSDKKITELPDGGAVQSTDEFVAARDGGNVKIAGSAVGGSITPPVVLESVNPADVTLTLNAVAADPDLNYVFEVYDKNGDLSIDIDNDGVLDTKRIAVQDPPNTGSGASVTLNPGRVEITPAIGNPGIIVFDAAANSAIVKVQPAGHGDLFEISPTVATDVPLLVIAHGSQSANLIELWDNSFSTLLFAVTPSGGIQATLPTSNPGPGLLWNNAGTVKVGT